MSPKPTLVFIPGAWHTASTWDKVIALTDKQQYKSIAVTLPSTCSNPAATLADDIKAIRDAIIPETTEGRDVVIVVHSYGGYVGASAIQGLTKSKDSTSSGGHVVGIAMMATGFAVTGLSFLDGLGGKPPPSWTIDSESGYAVLVAEPRQLFYHDLPVEEGEFWVKRLGQHSAKSLLEGGELAYAGWKDVPVWFLATVTDQAFPIEAQRGMVAGIQETGKDVTLREVEASHSPMLSKPEETAGFIMEAAASFVG